METKVKSSQDSAIRRVIDEVKGQVNLARLLNEHGYQTSQGTISKWLNGTQKPRMEIAIALEDITNGAVKASEVRKDLAAVFERMASR